MNHLVPTSGSLRPLVIFVLTLAVSLLHAERGVGQENDPEVDAANCSATLDSTSLAAAASPPDPTGVWAQKLTLTGLSKVPVVGKVTSVTETYQLVSIERDDRNDGTIKLTSKVCALNLRNNSSLVDPKIPEGFVRSLAKTNRTAQLVRRTSGWWLQVDRYTQVIGANLRHPPEESLPTRPDDPRVRDQDNDGHPGMTVRVNGIVSGELYLVQRGVDAWQARYQARDQLRGCVDWRQTQQVLDASNPFLGNGPDTRQHPEMSRSTVTLRRLEDSEAACSDVLQTYGVN